MKSFNVINYDINRQKFISYNILPYLVNTYEEIKKDKYRKTPETFEEFKHFVEKESMYQFWSRCEYEIILKDWPCQKVEEKWDVYDQIMMNLDVIAGIVMQECTINNIRGDAAVSN